MYTVRSKSSRTKAIKTKKKKAGIFSVYLFKIGSIRLIHRLARVSNLFMALEKSSAEILVSWLVTVF